MGPRLEVRLRYPGRPAALGHRARRADAHLAGSAPAARGSASRWRRRKGGCTGWAV